jgi:hypothetical protein
MHLYAQGGHAFGLRATKLPIGLWPALVERWLHTIGMLGSATESTWKQREPSSVTEVVKTPCR